ncbi:hypothetical protein JCM8547_008759 [Rhodosporidiobolus lusitaniae]
MSASAPYPRSTLRSLLRAHASSARQSWSSSSSKPPQLSGQVEALAYIAWLAHFRRLAREAEEMASEGQKGGSGKKRVGRGEVRKAGRKLLKQLEG